MFTRFVLRHLPVAVLAALSLSATAALANNGPGTRPWSQKRLEGLTPGAEKPVDLHNGSFHHAVSIDVPPFRGLEPELALTFNSSGGNGFVGVGWTLSGFSTIERVSSRSHGTRRCTADDTYTLDGEPLVACSSFGGTHCTKGETFRRIRFDAISEQWFVWAKDGSKRTYAKTFDVPLGTADVSCAYRYGLVAEEDVLGNRVTYRWHDDSAHGDVHKEIYPASVTYNGVTVAFHREERPDPISYANGFDWTNQRYRLKSIVVTVDSAGASNNGSDQVLRAFALSYGASPSGRSQLTSIRRYGREAGIDGAGNISGTVLSQQTFAYGGGSVGFTDHVGSNRFSDALGWTDVSNYSTMRPADIDGDGRMDICARADDGIHCHRQTGQGWEPFAAIQGSPALSDGNNWAVAKYFATIQFPDLNGDGRADLCARGTAGLHCWLNEGSTPALSRGIDVPAGGQLSDALGWGDELYYSSIQFPDVNGDGNADVCARAGAGVFCILQNPTGTGWANHVAGPAWSNGGGWSSPQYRTLQYPDINGDGRADVCGRSSEGIQCHLSTGNGFDLDTTWLGPRWSDANNWGDPKYYSTIQYPDINGDGKADVCGRGTAGMHCHLAIGSARANGVAKLAFDAEPITNPTLSDGNGFGAREYYSTIQFPDINGDGRADMCWRSSAGIDCDRSNGTSFTRVVTASPAWSNANAWTDVTNYSTIQFVDLNGDGKADLFGRHDGGLAGVFTKPDGPERLHAITNNGLGGSIRLTYAPSSTFPNTNNPPVDHVVTAMEVSDGRGNRSTTRYSYSGGQIDRATQRPLGFRYVKRTLSAIPGEEVAPFEEIWFMQGPYACVGALDYLKRSTGAGRLLTYTQRRYEARGSGAGPFTCQLDQQSDHVYDASGNSTCTAADNTHCKRIDINYDHDAYGNVTVVYDYGNYFDPEDDTTKETFYNHNPDAFIMNTASVERLHPGIGTGAVMIDERRIYYDGATSLDVPPAAGLATRTDTWVSSLGGAAVAPRYVSETKTYDGFGNVVAETDALGHRTSFAYDPVFNLFVESTTNPLGQTTSSTWDTVCGLPLSESDLNGQLTRFTYDAFCRMTRKDEPLGRFEAHVYSPLGNASNQFHRIETPGVAGIAGNLYEVVHFDGLRRAHLTQKRGPDQAVEDDILVETTFDARGNVRTRTLPRYAGAPAVLITFDHDELDRPVRASHADGTAVSTAYNLWTTLSRDEMGKEVARTVDADGRLVAVAEREGQTWHVARFTYDARGNPARTVDPAGNVSTYDYNSRGQKLAQSDPDLGPSSYAYDALGRLIGETDARGQRTELAYDAVGRLLVKRLGAQGGHPSVVRYVYDESRTGHFNIGRLTSMTDAAGVATYDYDRAGRLMRKSRGLAGATHTFRYAYDAGDRLMGTRYPDEDVVGDDPGTPGLETPLGYDGAGRLTSLPGIVDRVAYDGMGQITKISNANGTVTTRTYSPTRAWLDAITTARGSERLQDLTYVRDRQGKVTAATSARAGESWSYGYDSMARLSRASRTSGASEEQTFSYDRLGNLVQNSRLGLYTYPPPGAARPHAVLSAGVFSFRYDAAGNMLEGSGRSYEWDAESRLVKVTAGTSTTTFTYDGDGVRLEKNHNGAITRYFDSDYEVGPSGTVTKYFRVGEELVAKKMATKRYWLHGNHLQSVQVISDEAGNEVRRESQRAYGESLEVTGSHEESLRFTGQRVDETGLLYLNARYYDPVLGRFLSPDKVTPGDLIVALNRYAYAFNDPVNYIDPSGRVPKALVLWGVALLMAPLVVAFSPVVVAVSIAGAVTAVGMAYDYSKDDQSWRRPSTWAENAFYGVAYGAAVLPTGAIMGPASMTPRHLAGSAVVHAGIADGVIVEYKLLKMAARGQGHPEERVPMDVPQNRPQRPPFFVGPMMSDDRGLPPVPCAPPFPSIGPVSKHPPPNLGRPPRAQPHDRVERHRHFNFSSHTHDRTERRRDVNFPSRPAPPPPPPARARGGCFVAGTRVTMADGTQKPIEQIRVGEQVLAFDEATGQVHAAPVTQVFVHPDWKDQAETVLINGRLRATTNHPFFVNGRWTRAEHIRPGDLLRSLTPVPADHGPQRTTISEAVGTPVKLPGVDTVYNLEVDRYHTYFAEGVVVHNAILKY